ncbi:MAG: hypothetical protein QXN01_00565, partial [Candidatus Anstonellales archaeon]
MKSPYSFILLFLVFAAQFLMSQNCIIGDDDEGAGGNVVSGIPEKPELTLISIPSYSTTVSISNDWSGGCRAGSYFASRLCQLAQGAQNSQARCSILNQNNCNSLSAQYSDYNAPYFLQEQPAGCHWDVNSNSCVPDEGLEGESGPPWNIRCRGYTSGIDSATVANRNYCNQISGRSSCQLVTAGQGDASNFIYQFKWVAYLGDGPDFETPWMEGQSAMSFRCSDYPGCSASSPRNVHVRVRACSVYACTDYSQSDDAYYEPILPPSVSIKPKRANPRDVFNGIVTIPENIIEPNTINWRFELTQPDGMSVTIHQGTQAYRRGTTNYSYQTYYCFNLDNGCPDRSTLRFYATLSYGQGERYTSNETFDEATIDELVPEHPPPILSDITPNPATESQSPSLRITIPSPEGVSPQSLEWEWVIRSESSSEVLLSGSTQVQADQQLTRSIVCPLYESCSEGKTLVFKASIIYSDSIISAQESKEVLITKQPPQMLCGNGVLDQGEECDPGIENNCSEKFSCDPYSCRCIQTSFECGNGRCEGAEPVYCQQDCPSSGNIAALVHSAFFLIVLLIALAFMYSKYFGGNVHLDILLRDEAVHLGWSAIFAVLILATNFLENSNAVIGSFLNVPEGTTMYVYSTKYLDSLQRIGTAEVQRLTEGSLTNQLKATNYLFVGIPFKGGKGESKDAIRRAYSQSQEVMIDLLIPMIVSIKLQLELFRLLFISTPQENQPIIVLFLSFAIFLRVLPPTRTAGNYLMALCFSLYLIFPAIYTLFANTYPLTSQVLDSFYIAADPHVSFKTLALLLPQAVFLPNLAIIIIITSVHGFASAIRKVSEIG